MSVSAVERYHWDRETYKRAVEAGVFGDADVLLRHGEVVARVSPQGSRHAWAIQVLVKKFKGLPDDAFDLRGRQQVEVFGDPDRAARSYLGHVVQTGGELSFDGVRVTVADLF